MATDDIDVTMKLTTGPDGPTLTITGMRPTHRQSRWFATGFVGVTYQTDYNQDHHIDHVLGSCPKLDDAIARAMHAVSGREYLAGRITGPLQVVGVSLSPLREPDGRILVFFSVTLEEMPRLPRRSRKKQAPDAA